MHFCQTFRFWSQIRQLLVTWYNKWSHLATSGNTWQHVVTPGNIWSHLATIQLPTFRYSCWSHMAVNNAITPFCYLFSCRSQMATAGHLVRSGHICWLIISKGWSVQVCGGIISAISILPNLSSANGCHRWGGRGSKRGSRRGCSRRSRIHGKCRGCYRKYMIGNRVERGAGSFLFACMVSLSACLST